MKLLYKKGITLIELLIYVAIVGIILIAFSLFQKNIFVFNKQSDDSLQVIANARTIVRTMVKELRSASPGSDGSYPIVQAATSTVIFYSDVNDDGLKERIRYYLSGTSLFKGVVTPTGAPLTYNLAQEVTSTLMYNVRNDPGTPVFEYYDSTYDGTNAPLPEPLQATQVRLVKINLLLDKDVNKSPPARLYTSQVMLRNVKDNL